MGVTHRKRKNHRMQLVYKESLGLPQGFRVNIYEAAEVVELTKDPKKLANITNFINMYLGQKDVLVWGRADLVHSVQVKTSFNRLTEKNMIDGKERIDFAETEAEYLKRFVEEAIKGGVKEIKVDLAQEPDAREKVVYAFLQALANQCGDFDEKGTAVVRDKDDWLTGPAYAYKLDVTRPEKKAAVAKIPKYALEGASNIIDKGGDKSVKAWAEKLTKGFTAKTGEKIMPIAFLPFDTKATNGAPPEAVEAIRQTNLNNLALAIVEIEEQKRTQRAGEYA